ncbi:MAG: 16S rRNA pseudouridine(516) synthase [Spirochaetae bacterium HGW-Spirochaetae-7]|jgi:16S rRNA pseudouridine516 synthase|nr:MAG: 16S rRNA pseudouridine(516) synthase [Spirochaetae bacterium HGW-Spirochaetae-7]
MMTLDKILQSQGFGSRKGCRALVSGGFVQVGGQGAPDYTRGYDTAGLEFGVNGETWLYREKLYLALNKPGDIECSRKPSHHPSVLTLFPEQFAERNLQPVGRLDHDTTGLLLLSDDGAFIHAQSSPRRHVPKVYRATTARPVTAELVAALKAGVQLVDEPAPLQAVTCEALDEWRLEIVLEQGKYHQVKRMLAAAGNHCAALERIAIGRLRLDDLRLPPGKWTFLDESQLALLAAD